jgi:hypothetical protein
LESPPQAAAVRATDSTTTAKLDRLDKLELVLIIPPCIVGLFAGRNGPREAADRFRGCSGLVGTLPTPATLSGAREGAEART